MPKPNPHDPKLATQSPRPGSVTWAGFVLLGVGAVVLMSLMDTIGSVRSAENREAVEAFLDSSVGSGLGLSVERVLVIQHYLALLCGAASAAATVLGGWLLRGPDKSIRLALTLLAVPLFITGWALNIFGVTMMGAAIVLLWMQPSRDWFNNVTPEPVTAPVSPAPPAWPPPPGTVPGAHPRPRVTSAQRRADRPEAVLLAALITWVIAALFLLSGLALLVMITQNPQTLLDELHRQQGGQVAGITERALMATAYAASAVLVVFSGAAIVMAAVMLRRQRWAAHVLTVLAVVLTAFGLISAITAPFMVGPAMCGLAIAALIRRRDVRDWYDGRS